MADLHKRHTGKSGPTDVLTFDLRDDPSKNKKNVIEGDIVVCLAVARREAKRRGHATRLEILLYALHGLLHLLGYDDHDAVTYRKMHAREDELLAQIGLKPLFKAKAGR